MQQHEEHFNITVNNKTYSVTAFCEADHCSRFTIQTDCEYLFTLRTNDEGQWEAEPDVTVMDESLIEQMGRAIDEYDLR